MVKLVVTGEWELVPVGDHNVEMIWLREPDFLSAFMLIAVP